jgi:hypothetical protein
LGRSRISRNSTAQERFEGNLGDEFHLGIRAIRDHIWWTFANPAFVKAISISPPAAKLSPWLYNYQFLVSTDLVGTRGPSGREDIWLESRRCLGWCCCCCCCGMRSKATGAVFTQSSLLSTASCCQPLHVNPGAPPRLVQSSHHGVWWGGRYEVHTSAFRDLSLSGPLLLAHIPCVIRCWFDVSQFKPLHIPFVILEMPSPIFVCWLPWR